MPNLEISPFVGCRDSADRLLLSPFHLCHSREGPNLSCIYPRIPQAQGLFHLQPELDTYSECVRALLIVA